MRPILHQRVMLEGSESPKILNKLVIQENVPISAFNTVILYEMGPKLDFWGPNKVNNSSICLLEGPESPKGPHKLVLPENVPISAFYTVLMGEMDPKVANLVNLAETGLRVNFNIISAFFFLFLMNIFFVFVCKTNHCNKKMCFININCKK